MNFNDLSQNAVSDAHLTVSELSLSYHPSSKTVLDQISFELPQGQIACLVGQSGCGKTSLLRCIAGLKPRQQAQFNLASGRYLIAAPTSISLLISARLALCFRIMRCFRI